MIDYVIRNMQNPLDNIQVDLGVDEPLWMYVKKAIQDIEILNILQLNPFRQLDEGDGKQEATGVKPFIHVVNWNWNPHPLAEEIQYRRRETGDKLSTKMIGRTRIGILSFDIFVEL